MTAEALTGVVLDFDGTMVDSEMPIYRSTAAVLSDMGLDLTVAGWATVVGHGEDDSFAALCRAVGRPFDREEFDARYARQDRGWHDSLPVLPGVVELLDDLAAQSVPVAVASSSPSSWVEGHLDRLGLLPRFAAIATRDRVGGRTKPDPASYVWAVEQLGVDRAGVVAIEDSGPGIAAAVGANLAVVAIASEITRHTDLSQATAAVGSIADLGVERLASVISDLRP